MIRFCNWKIACDGPLLAMQYDNLTRELKVAGNLPEGYDWAALVQVNRYFDIIALERTLRGAVAVLTAKQLSQSGYYTVQLRGTKGDKVRHTNTIQVAVGRSLSGDENWPEIPSEFTQLEQRMYEAMHNAADSEAGAIEAAKNAKASETTVKDSADAAEKAAQGAAGSEQRAILAETNAGNSETAAKAAAENAAANEKAASNSAAEARASAEAAKKSEENLEQAVSAASASATDAEKSAKEAAAQVEEAYRYANIAVNNAATTGQNALASSSYAETARNASISAKEAAESAAKSAKQAEDAAAGAGGIDPSEIAGGVEAIVVLAECGVLTPAYENGAFYTDADGAVYIL